MHKKTEIFLSGDLLLARDRSYPWSRPSPRPILVTILEESEKRLGLGQKTKKNLLYIQKQNGRQAHMGPIIYFIKGTYLSIHNQTGMLWSAFFWFRCQAIQCTYIILQ